MIPPEVDASEIQRALKEFDETLRDDLEWKGWEEHSNQRFALESEGRRYPPKKILSMATGIPVGRLMGGRPTNSYLEKRGYKIVSLRSLGIQGQIEHVLSGYPQARLKEAFGATASMYRAFHKLGETFGSLESITTRKTVKVVSSAGQGNWARVPWISFLHEQETSSTQRGVYVVILFAQDGSSAYVTFNQGVTEPKQSLGASAGMASLRARAEEIRKKSWCKSLEEAGFSLSNSIDLKVEGGLGADYEASTIAFKKYTRGDVPADDEIVGDVEALLTAYESYVKDKQAPSATHLLLKWSSSRNPRTIELHKAVSDQKGSVWWGKFGESISAGKLASLREQIRNGVETKVFLVGGESAWMLACEDITTELKDVDDARFPGYYAKTDCGLFVRLSDFREVGIEWLKQNTVLESRPQAGSTSAVLNNQSSFAYVRITSDAATPEATVGDSELCLIGTWKGYASELDEPRNLIAKSGAFASRWSFSVKELAQSELKSPFFVYINSGGGVFPLRMKVEEFVTSSGLAGRVSPWPASTPPDEVGKQILGDFICKTWFKVTALEMLSPPLALEDFEVDTRLSSTQQSLLNQSTFGYARRRAEDPMEALAAATLLERTVLEQIVGALTTSSAAGGSPQVVLAGPPGTSKTWVAEAIAAHIAPGSDRVRLVQFHPNYSYESFVEGLRPIADDGGITFKLEPGALVDFVNSMQAKGEAESTSPRHAVLIDEMNRANLPRVFGELMYLFEYRDKAIRLQYSQEFRLPGNLVFIGTMNTADRSIRSIDIALRRRFDVFELRPDPGVLRRYFGKHALNVSNLIAGFEKLNQQLEAGLDRHHTIGHAFFMKPGLNRLMLRAIWDRKIYPLIEEYFFDQLDIAREEYKFEKFWPE